MNTNESQNNILRRIIYIIVLIFLIIVAVFLYERYSKSNFNDFVRTEYVLYTSDFVRDHEVRYSKSDSYKIVSNEMNDAMFYKTINVTPNTPYKVSCMVKTENVKTEKAVSNGGAHISIANTVEKSKSITGTNDWQLLEFTFNSKNRTSVNIGFRLGGYDDNCTGTVWFSDFTLEVTSSQQNNSWNFACFIFENTQVTMENNGVSRNINLSMTADDIFTLQDDMQRFKNSLQELSHNKIKVNYNIIRVKEPITSLSYDDKNGYYVGPENVEKIIEKYINNTEYDHIFICVRLGDNEHKNDIPVYDWIGLGGMDYLGIGFSNIRLPNASSNIVYTYSSGINTFPEEVFVHEFLHSLERDSIEYGYTIPALHDNEKYGYKEEGLTGLKSWYEDYMNCNIKSGGQKIGLPEKAFTFKPTHIGDFKYSYKIDEFKEPSNIIEVIKQMLKNVVKNFNAITIKKGENNT